MKPQDGPAISNLVRVVVFNDRALDAVNKLIAHGTRSVMAVITPLRSSEVAKRASSFYVYGIEK